MDALLRKDQVMTMATKYRFDFGCDGWKDCVLASDYDALAAELGQWHTDYQAQAAKLYARVAYLEGALRVIADGTICPDLFPLDSDENVIAAKTAMVTAIAALGHSESETKGDQS